ncbi:MAG TPA: RsmE family RNA methyltransferase, partial [Rhodoferax sp.]|nr:RsmE family RNA methyltransferase [Rhodoferax sp.]
QDLPANGMDARWLLSLCDGSSPLSQHLAHGITGHTTFLSGPEGGFSPAEEAGAASCGFTPVTLGPRTLRAETAALVALARLLA